jgi:transketolase
MEYLKRKAKEIRKKILEMAIDQDDGHIAPAYSAVDIIMCLYENIINKDDKFILSKGHGCLALYAILEDRGLCPKYSGHPDIDEKNGIFCTTGSLGHGLPIAAGMALAKKYKKKNGHIFVMIGDGECQEGTTWESLNLAKHFKLDNLTIIIDNNKLQALNSIKKIMSESNLYEKFKVFGCNTYEIEGHDFNDILNFLSSSTIKKDMPRAIVANTIKGKGLSFMEGKPEWHSRIPEGELLKIAYKELR